MSPNNHGQGLPISSNEEIVDVQFEEVSPTQSKTMLDGLDMPPFSHDQIVKMIEAKRAEGLLKRRVYTKPKSAITRKQQAIRKSKGKIAAKSRKQNRK